MNLEVTNPTGLNLSPGRNPYPGVLTLNSDTSNNSDPIPVKSELGVVLASIFNPTPVSVVGPIPLLEIPITERFSYEGSETNISGSM